MQTPTHIDNSWQTQTRTHEQSLLLDYCVPWEELEVDWFRADKHRDGGTRLTWKEDARNHARENDDPHWQKLKVASQQRPGFGVSHVFRSKSPLYDDLVTRNKHHVIGNSKANQHHPLKDDFQRNYFLNILFPVIPLFVIERFWKIFFCNCTGALPPTSSPLVFE